LNREKKNTPKSSAQPTQAKGRQNLTLHDWMTVFAYVNTLPKGFNQADVVNHFASLPTGALVFAQSTLSRKLKAREELERWVMSNPNALSSKRPCIVTQPEVDHALALWVRHMGEKGKLVNSAMLQTK
jgi:hypothetical protein